MFRKLKPIYFENSLVPEILSYFAPINIKAITIVFFVFARGELSDRVKNHERIHLQQYLECFIVFFLLIYLVDFVFGYLKYRDGRKAYLRIRFEQEAYAKDQDLDYCEKREVFSWLNYKI